LNNLLRGSFELIERKPLARLFREQGHVLPKPHGGGRSAGIPSSHHSLLLTLGAEQLDTTSVEICSLYLQQADNKVSKSCMAKTLHRFSITRKKTAVSAEQESPAFSKKPLTFWSKRIQLQPMFFLFFWMKLGTILR
jgi:hypothetical protein